MEDILLPYRVCDARYHSVAAGNGGDGESDYQVLFATNERWEAIAAARDSGGGACVVLVESDTKSESVIFINEYDSQIPLTA